MDFNEIFDTVVNGISTTIDFSKEMIQDLVNQGQEFKKQSSLAKPVDANGIPWTTSDMCFKLGEKEPGAEVYTLDYISIDQDGEWWLMSSHTDGTITKAKANECYHIKLDIACHHSDVMQDNKTNYNTTKLYVKCDDDKYSLGRKCDDDKYSLSRGYSYTRAHKTDAGADIYTPISFDVEPHSGYVVHTKTHIQLPKGTVGMIKSKSGLYTKHGIITTGVIDEGFTGEIIVRVSNLSDEPYHFNVGDKLTQLVVLPVLYPEIDITDKIFGGDRGDDGYGSTGR